MAGFFILDVPEFSPLLDVARKKDCVIGPLIGGYRYIEFNTEIEFTRAELSAMSDAVWFGCLTAGLVGRIAAFDNNRLKLIATNEPIIME